MQPDLRVEADVANADVAPLDLELVGQDLGERGADMLAHLGLVDPDDGLAGRVHREPEIGREALARGGVGEPDAVMRGEAEDQAGSAGADQEGPPADVFVHDCHRFLPHISAAARLIALPIRA